MSRRRRQNSKYDGSVYRSMALIMQFGINMLVPIGMMCALGIWLDGKFGTSFWTVILFFVGAVAGGQNVYRMAKSVYAPEDKTDRTVENDPQENDPEETDSKTRADSDRR